VEECVEVVVLALICIKALLEDANLNLVKTEAIMSTFQLLSVAVVMSEVAAEAACVVAHLRIPIMDHAWMEIMMKEITVDAVEMTSIYHPRAATMVQVNLVSVVSVVVAKDLITTTINLIINEVAMMLMALPTAVEVIVMNS